MSVHERIASALGWSIAEVHSFSLAALRDIVRPVDPSLANEISDTIQAGWHLTTGPTRFSKRNRK